MSISRIPPPLPPANHYGEFDSKPIEILLPPPLHTNRGPQLILPLRAPNTLNPPLSRHTGGVTIFIKESIIYKILINEACDGNWFLSISSTISKKSFIFSLVYHSPSSSNAHFVNLLEWWFDKFLDLGQDNI